MFKLKMKSAKINFIIFLAVFAYVCLNSYLSRGLWFWWDDLTILKSQNSQFFGLLQNHEGNFFPLGRLIFFLERIAFGDKYYLYVALNSFAVCILMKLLYEIIYAETKPNQFPKILLISLIGGFAFNLGVVYDTQWAIQISWFLSVGFILAGIYFFNLKEKPVYILGIFFLLSWLAFGSLILPCSLLYLSLIKYKNFHSQKTPYKFTLQYFLYSLLLFLGGTLIIQFYPSVDSSAMPPPIDLQISFAHLYGVFLRLVVSSFVWLMSPISLFQSGLLKNFNNVGNYFLEHHVAAIVLIVLSFTLIFKVGQSHIFSKSKLPFFGLVFFSLLVAIRGYETLNSDFSIRYAPVQYLFAILFWWGILSQLYNTQMHVKLRILLSCLVVGTSVMTLFFSLWTISSASDATRLQFTKKQLSLAQSCFLGKEISLLPVVQPSFNSHDFCNLFLELKK
jgi:hypothetical protein